MTLPADRDLRKEGRTPKPSAEEAHATLVSLFRAFEAKRIPTTLPGCPDVLGYDDMANWFLTRFPAALPPSEEAIERLRAQVAYARILDSSYLGESTVLTDDVDAVLHALSAPVHEDVDMEAMVERCAHELARDEWTQHSWSDDEDVPFHWYAVMDDQKARYLRRARHILTAAFTEPGAGQQRDADTDLLLSVWLQFAFRCGQAGETWRFAGIFSPTLKDVAALLVQRSILEKHPTRDWYRWAPTKTTTEQETK